MFLELKNQKIELNLVEPTKKQKLESAILLALGTDSKIDGERGWWGSNLGNSLWHIRANNNITASALHKVEVEVKRCLSHLSFVKNVKVSGEEGNLSRVDILLDIDDNINQYNITLTI